MKINKMIAAGLLAAGMVSAAQAGEVSCPSADAVKGSVKALNAVIRQSSSSYFVLSAQPVITQSNLGWIVMTQASGSGFDAAHAAGSNEVKSVVAPAMEEPVEMQGVYLCAYFTASGGMDVMAVAPQQQGIVFNPAKLKLDAIKLKN